MSEDTITTMMASLLIFKEVAVRLGRLMCGMAMPFRTAVFLFEEAAPPIRRSRRSLSLSQPAERQSLSAHQTA